MDLFTFNQRSSPFSYTNLVKNLAFVLEGREVTRPAETIGLEFLAGSGPSRVICVELVFKVDACIFHEDSGTYFSCSFPILTFCGHQLLCNYLCGVDLPYYIPASKSANI